MDFGKRLFVPGRAAVLDRLLSIALVWSAAACLPAMLIAGPLPAVAASAMAPGKGNGVEARSASSLLQEVSPGQMASLSFIVTAGTVGGDIQEAIKLPDGWEVVVPPGQFQLSPGESTNRISAIMVPGNAPAGRYPVTYSVQNLANPAVRDSVDLEILVPAISKLALIVEDKPDYVVAGSEMQAKVRVVNQGNTAVTLPVAVEPRQTGVVAHIEPAQVTIAPGSSAVVTVRAGTDPHAEHAGMEYVTVHAGSKTSLVSLTFGTQVYPRASRAEDLDVKLPAEMTFAVGGSNANAGGLVGLSGSGAIDETGRRKVDFLVQASGLPQDNPYNLRSEAHFNYTAPGFDIRMGDQVYSLSMLTDFLHYGRGIQLDSGLGSHTGWGGYYLSDYGNSSQGDAAAAWVRYDPSDRLKIKLNLLSAGAGTGCDPGTTPQRNTISSLGASLTPWKNTRLETEYAHSLSGGTDPDAYMVDLEGRAGSLGQYTFRKTHAGADYNGYYHDSDATMGSLVVPFSKSLGAMVSYSAWMQNVDLRPDRLTAPEESLEHVEIHDKLPGGWFASAGFDSLRSLDRLAPDKDDWQEQPIDLALGRGTGTSSYRLEYLGGQSHDNPTGLTSHTDSLRFFTSFNPSSQKSFAFYGGVGSGSRESHLLAGNNFLGASMTWRPSPVFALQGWATMTEAIQETGGNSIMKQLDLQACYQMSNGSKLKFQCMGSSSPGSAGGIQYLVAYSVPFGIPVARKKKIGALHGRLYSGLPGARAACANVVLMLNGMAAVSDAGGRFSFSGLKPGHYLLGVDSRTGETKRIPDCAMPIPVEIVGGRVASVEINMVEAAGFSGAVRLAPEKPGPSTGAGALVGDPTGASTPASTSSGVANVLVELSSGSDVVRRTTDSNGAFLFEGLRPGKWRFRVYEETLPPYQVLETPDPDVTLAAGNTLHIQVRVKPLARQIQMVDDGGPAVLSVR